MKDNLLANKTFEFALQITSLCKNNINHPIYNQLFRSGTSIGANVYESEFAQTKADFVTKLQISLKECNETLYWLNLLEKSGIARVSLKPLLDNCSEIKYMLVSSCKTAKK